MDEREIIDAVKERDIFRLRELAGVYSDQAGVDQDQRKIKLSLITYSLNKIYGKIHFRQKTKKMEEKVVRNLKEGDLDGVLEAIYDFDREHGLFHEGLSRKARVKIGSRLYSQGLSMSQAASLVNTHVNDIQDYVGVTKEHEVRHGKSLEKRFSSAKEILK